MYRGVESLCKLLTANKVPFDLPTNKCKSKILSILKLVSFEKPGMTSLNGLRKRRLTAKETSIANCEVLDEKYCIAVQGIFEGILIKAGGLR